ncbi:MAG TPA: mechanosensitive ion channel domain-containing protein [Mycobacteriales bacterium]|nr:mechanosensitive ion channel domain-containing protein [Mycobacteriales bacterium]
MLDTLADAAPRVGVGLALLVALVLVGRALGAYVHRRWSRLERPSFAAVMSRVVRLATGLVGVLVAVTVIFPTVKPVDVLGSLGFFSIAIGFAFRDILENLLAGMLLLLRAPFRTGDEVDVEGTRGTVEEVNLRETVVRTYDGRRVLLPNATVYKNPLTVQTGYPAVRTEAVVGVAYESDVEAARGTALQALHDCELVLDDPAPLVLVGELGTSTVDLQLLFWSGSRQRDVRLARDEALAAVKAALDDAGVEMPADIVVLQGTPSLRGALRDDGLETSQAGGVSAAG